MHKTGEEEQKRTNFSKIITSRRGAGVKKIGGSEERQKCGLPQTTTLSAVLFRKRPKLVTTLRLRSSGATPGDFFFIYFLFEEQTVERVGNNGRTEPAETHRKQGEGDWSPFSVIGGCRSVRFDGGRIGRRKMMMVPFISLGLSSCALRFEITHLSLVLFFSLFSPPDV